jgi:hypothetical protein
MLEAKVSATFNGSTLSPLGRGVGVGCFSSYFVGWFVLLKRVRNPSLRALSVTSFHFFSGMKRNETKKNPARINSLGRGLMLLFQLG